MAQGEEREIAEEKVKDKKVKKIRGVYEKVAGSGVWWIQYFDARGRRRREKAGTKSAAITLYSKRKTEALGGRKLPENLRSVVKVSDLAPAILRDYEINGKKSLDSVARRLRKHLLPFFGGMPASELGTDDFNRYIDLRKKAGAANATLNREMAALKRVFRLARHGNPPKLRDLPVFPARLKESPPRQGFVDDQQYTILLKHAEEPWLKALIATAYAFAFRKSELLLQLKVSQLDFVERTIRLYAGTTKNDQGRTVKMTDEVYALLQACVAGKKSDEYVFARDGRPVRDFRQAWWTACQKAGLGKFVKEKDRKGRLREKWKGLVPHDLRRSAARKMRRYGVDEGVIMQIGGWKTRSVFERYNIVSEADITEASRKIEEGQRRSAASLAKPSATTSATDRKRGPKTDAAKAS
jgi:integrase